MQNLHDRVIAMSGRADRRNIGRWYQAKLYFVTFVTWNITAIKLCFSSLKCTKGINTSCGPFDIRFCNIQ
jgi:hypothetical protein